MNKKKKLTNKLTEPQKAFIVQGLACYETPSEVAKAVKAEFELEISPQRAESYDPTKRAGARLSKHWRELFNRTRKAFLEHVEKRVPEANKAVRVNQLAQAARAYREKGNYIAMADMLEKIARELGNVHTNRRELTGRDGKPIAVDYTDMSDEQINARLAYLMGLATGEAIEEGDDEQQPVSDQIH